MRLGYGLCLGGTRTGAPSGPPSITASVSGLTSNPTYGATAQVGTVLTGTLNNLVGGEVIAHRWRTSAGLIAGANAATYAVALGGNVTDAGNIWYSPTVDASEVNSAVYTVRHAAPSTAGGLADQNWVENIAISTFDVSADFTALGETYAVQTGTLPTGLSLSSAGLITGTPTEIVADREIFVRGSNSGGYVDTVFSVTVAAAGAGAAVDYGALTLAGHGGLALPAGAASITNAGGTNLEVSTGMVVPAAGGGVSSGTVVFNNGTEWTVTALADTYHITGSDADNAVEFNAVKSTVGTGFGGKTVKLRAGSVHSILDLQNTAITGTLKIEGEVGGVKPVVGQVHSQNNTTSGNLEVRDFKCDAASPTAPIPYSQFEIYGTGGTTLIERVEFSGLFDPAGLTDLDYKAQLTVDTVSGGSIAVDDYVSGPNGNRNRVLAVTDQGGGTFKIWVSDNITGYTDTADNILVSDTLTFYSDSGFAAPTGASCTATSVASSWLFDNPDSRKNVILIAGAAQGRQRVTVQNCTFSKCGRPLGTQVPYDFTDNVVDTYAGDGINGGWYSGEIPEACSVRRNTFMNSMLHGSDHKNPHGDTIQTPQGVTANWPGWIIDENYQILGAIGRELQPFVFIQFDNDVLAYGWRISNNIGEGAIAVYKAQACVIANNTVPGFPLTELNQYILIGDGAGSGGNIIANNVAQNFIITGTAVQINNVTLVPANYDYCFEETDYSTRTADKAAALIRYTPKSGGDLMGGAGGTGGHADPWVASDVGAVNSASVIPAYVNTIGPIVSSTSPADDATGVAVDANLSMTFSESIAFGTGNIVLRENNGGWVDLEAFDVTTDTGGGAGTVSISGNVLTVEPTSDFVSSREYAVRVAGTAIENLSGDSYIGISDDTAFSFTAVSAPSDLMPPALGNFSDATLWIRHAPFASISGGELVLDGSNSANGKAFETTGSNKIPVSGAGDYYFDFICSEDTGGVETTFLFDIYRYESGGYVGPKVTCTVVCPAGTGPSNNGSSFAALAGTVELEMVIKSVTAGHDRKYSQMRLFKV